MKKLYFLICTLLITSISFGQDLIITGVFDGPLSGGLPKGVELYAVNNIADLSIYGLGSANNGGDTDGVELVLSGSSNAGDFIYIGSDQPQFNAFFGFDPDFVNSAANINGDDAIELFGNVVDSGGGVYTGTVIDVFGDIMTDGTGTAWEYMDGWAYRKDGTGPDGSTFVSANWTFSGPNALDGETTNAGATTPIPIGTYATTVSTAPTLFIVDGPANGSATTGSPEDGGDIDVYFGTTNFTVATPPANDGYIVWEVKNSGNTTIAGGNDYDTSTPNLFNLPQGDTYTLNAELVDPSGASLNPAVIYAITFTVPEYIQVANLAALRASTIGDDLYYQVTGEVIGTFMQTYRNQKYIQDATAGILVDDPNFFITTVYNIGDGVVNIKGQLSSYNGVLQFLPVEDAPEIPANSTGNIITPEVVTNAELAANWENYESELVEIKGATFVGASGNFATGTNYTINDGTGDLDFRTSFFDVDYIGMPIPITVQNLVVLVAEFNGSPQVTARELSDLTLRVGRNDIDGFSLYPNPVTNGKLMINTINNGTKEIQIFNILGKSVLSTNLKGKELNVSKLNSGIYILKIQENGKTATRKLVIK